MAGSREEQAWKPALAEIEEALVPAFIIEEAAWVSELTNTSANGKGHWDRIRGGQLGKTDFD